MARNLLQRVIAAAHGLRVVVVAPSDAEDVKRCALVNGARFLAEPDENSGLNSAVAYGVEQLVELGYDRVAIVNGDLPNVTDISWLATTDGVVVVPDHTGVGTNALAIPSRSGFHFHYGNDSFAKHCDEARRIGIEPSIVMDPEVVVDIDHPEDMEQPGIDQKQLFAAG